MKHVLLKMKAIGMVVLLTGGVVGYSLTSAMPAGASVLVNTLTAKVASARSLAAIGGPAANLENAGDWARCLDANSNDYPKNGDGIQLWSCNTHPEQEWTLTSAGQLQNAGTGMCLDANSNQYPKSGDGIQLWSCNTHPEQEWRLDWASSSFCATHFNAPYMGTTFDGVAACGVKYTGSSSNYQGKITYNGVMLNSYGFQCVELAARYFDYVTGHNPPGANGGGYAWAVYKAYPQYGISPGGANGGVSSYQNTLVAGDIISMWSSSNLTGHVAIVTSVALNSAQTGKIYLIDENAGATGSDAITVTNGKMSFYGLNDFQWVYNLP
jgi:hypothetical protein